MILRKKELYFSFIPYFYEGQISDTCALELADFLQ